MLEHLRAMPEAAGALEALSPFEQHAQAEAERQRLAIQRRREQEEEQAELRRQRRNLEIARCQRARPGRWWVGHCTDNRCSDFDACTPVSCGTGDTHADAEPPDSRSSALHALATARWDDRQRPLEMASQRPLDMASQRPLRISPLMVDIVHPSLLQRLDDEDGVYDHPPIISTGAARAAAAPAAQPPPCMQVPTTAPVAQPLPCMQVPTTAPAAQPPPAADALPEDDEEEQIILHEMSELIDQEAHLAAQALARCCATSNHLRVEPRKRTREEREGAHAERESHDTCALCDGADAPPAWGCAICGASVCYGCMEYGDGIHWQCQECVEVGGCILRLELGQLFEITGVSHHSGVQFKSVELVHGKKWRARLELSMKQSYITNSFLCNK